MIGIGVLIPGIEIDELEGLLVDIKELSEESWFNSFFCLPVFFCCGSSHCGWLAVVQFCGKIGFNLLILTQGGSFLNHVGFLYGYFWDLG